MNNAIEIHENINIHEEGESNRESNQKGKQREEKKSGLVESRLIGSIICWTKRNERVGKRRHVVIGVT